MSLMLGLNEDIDDDLLHDAMALLTDDLWCHLLEIFIADSFNFKNFKNKEITWSQSDEYLEAVEQPSHECQDNPVKQGIDHGAEIGSHPRESSLIESSVGSATLSPLEPVSLHHIAVQYL